MIVVNGMTCNHCRNNVEKAILKVEGVERVEIDLSSEQVIVYGEVDKETVIQAVESIGFDVK